MSRKPTTARRSKRKPIRKTLTPQTSALSLDGTWQLHEEPLSVSADAAPRILGTVASAEPADAHAASQASNTPADWIDTPIPGDIRQGLIAAGRIPEPLEGINSLDQHWIEDRSWWLRRTFDVPARHVSPGPLHTAPLGPSLPSEGDTTPPQPPPAWPVLELELNGLDSHASIFLNGQHIGDHPSAFRPFLAKVNGIIRAGENILLVRLTTGVEDIRAEDYQPMKGFQPTEDSRGLPMRGDRRRPFVRKAQFTWGWDWAPRCATVAIGGHCELRILHEAAIRDVQVTAQRTPARNRASAPPPKPSADSTQAVSLTIAATVQWLNPYASGQGTLHLTVRDPDGKVAATAQVQTILQSGLNFIDLPVSLPAARLWWPSGMGKQPRYSIEVNLRTPTRRIIHPPLLYGIRFIELDTANTFTVRCNEQPLFCKGGNWIPPDSLYARATDASYDTLVREAAAANFNMLRIWGGGIYPPDSFFEACDREGILVWHDFMLACSPYPDHIESFRDEIAREADYQTRRLRNHASMALWCGSNELSYCMGAGDHLTDKGTRLLGEVLPAAVHRNCPQIPYWYTSPSGGATPDDWTAGDCHFWAVPMQSEHVKRYEPKLFDQCGALFVSEYGYPGPACRQTMSDYLIGRSSPSPIRKTPDTPDAHYDRADPLWRHHMNTFDQGAFDKGIAKHYIDPLNATLDEFIYYGGLTQGLMYGYSLESLRAKPRCHGALFWMYNDTWGEVGWTIIDYYLRRKSSFWFVRRAFAPIRLILRETGAAAAPSDGLSSTASALTSSSSVAAPSAAASSRASRARASEKIAILLANDTLNPVRATVEYGYVSTAGNYAIAGRKKFTAPPMARTTLALFPRGQHDPQAGLWFARIVPPNSSAHSIAPGSALDILPATLTDCDFRHLHITRPTLTVTARATAQREARARTHAHYITQFTVSSNIFAHSVELLLPPGVLPSDNLFDLLPGEHRTITLTTQIPRAIRAPHLTSARLLVSGCRLHRDNSFRHAARMRALPRSR